MVTSRILWGDEAEAQVSPFLHKIPVLLPEEADLCRVAPGEFTSEEDGLPSTDLW